ncbi:MAG: M14 family zinc carboxypeptidase [Gemmatimonadota bacterium]|nr:M14 family zinc carboxypeptidase [Gemmatimonadota bacterium]
MSPLNTTISRAWQALREQPLHISYLGGEMLYDACDTLARDNADITMEEIGISRLGRPLFALTLGSGPTNITIKGNAHADEPAGIVTCLVLARLLTENPVWQILNDHFRFFLIPTANPDGLARNWEWLDGAFDLKRYFMHVYRDLPCDDVEFGYPASADTSVQDIRPENMACARFFDTAAPVAAHLSLHSIVFTGGAWFLIAADTNLTPFEPSLSFVTDACVDEGIPLHDEDRGGQKGFTRLREGFHSIPTVEGMKAFFNQSGDTALASDFRINSMQYAMKNCGARFAAVSELPYAFDRALANMTPTGLTRRDLELRRVDQYTIGLNELADTLDRFHDLPKTGEGQFWMDYFSAYLAYRRSSLKSLMRDMGRYADKQATLRDLYEVNLLELRHRIYNSAAGNRLSRFGEHPNADEWGKRYRTCFDQQFDEMASRFQFQVVSLVTQVRLQLAIILAGLIAVGDQETSDLKNE